MRYGKKIPKDLKEVKIREKTDGDSEKIAVTFNEVAEANKKLATAVSKQHMEAVRIPEQTDHLFHSKLTSHSGANCPLIPLAN